MTDEKADLDIDGSGVEVNYPAGQTLTLAYDSGGRVSSISGPQGTVGYGYDPDTGKLTAINAPDANISYGYDGVLQTSESWVGAVNGSLNRTYNNDFRVTQDNVNGSNAATYAYDDDGLLIQSGPVSISRNPQNGLITATSAGVLDTTFTYNTFGELSNQRTKVSGTAVYDVSYSHDKLGHITQKIETIQGVTHTYDYTYDLTRRLTEVKTDGIVTATYTYDANDNRQTATIDGILFNATIDNQDRLNQYGGIAYTYDLNGSLQSRTEGGSTTTYSYDVMSNLRQVVLPDTTTITYLIDGNDRRIAKHVNGVPVQGLLYDGQYNPVAELDGSGSIVARYIYGPRGHVPVTMQKGGTTYRIISDMLGSVRLVIKESDGSIAQRLDYDEWGNVTNDSNPGFQVFGFAGGLYDADTRLVRFGARDYDPEVGRWTARDPIGFGGGQTNLYVYVGNNPINYVDPTGLAPCDGDPDCIDNCLENRYGWSYKLASEYSPLSALGLLTEVYSIGASGWAAPELLRQAKRNAWGGFLSPTNYNLGVRQWRLLQTLRAVSALSGVGAVAFGWQGGAYLRCRWECSQ